MDLGLNELQLDALKEVGNIGSGNAATALSQLLGKSIDMKVPEIDILQVPELIRTLGDDEDVFVGVLLKVYGDILGNILFLLEASRAKELSKILLNDMDEFDSELGLSMFQEMGNILGNSYLKAISKLTKLNMVTSVPAVCIDMLSALLTASFMEAEQYSDYVLAIDTSYHESSNGLDEHKSGGAFLLIPKPGSLSIILSKLGL